MTLIVPTLETDRLTLRGPRETDFEVVAGFATSSRRQFLGGPQSDRFQQWRCFLAVMGHWALRGHGFFTLQHKHTDTILGRVGVVRHEMWPEPELGWQIFDGFEGQGFAFEAATAVRDWAYTAHGFTPLASFIHPDNLRSVALADRMGAKRESSIDLLGAQCDLYRHTGPQEVAA